MRVRVRGQRLRNKSSGREGGRPNERTGTFPSGITAAIINLTDLLSSDDDEPPFEAKKVVPAVEGAGAGHDDDPARNTSRMHGIGESDRGRSQLLRFARTHFRNVSPRQMHFTSKDHTINRVQRMSRDNRSCTSRFSAESSGIAIGLEDAQIVDADAQVRVHC